MVKIAGDRVVGGVKALEREGSPSLYKTASALLNVRLSAMESVGKPPHSKAPDFYSLIASSRSTRSSVGGCERKWPASC